MAVTVEKRANESFFLEHQFLRADGTGWLGEGEAIIAAAPNAPTVTAIDKSTGLAASGITSDISVVDGTVVRYKVSAGTVDKTYKLVIKVVTSAGQIFEDVVFFKVVD